MSCYNSDALGIGTRTICQHCFGNNRGLKAASIFSHNRLCNAAMHTFLVYNDGMTVAHRDLPRITCCWNLLQCPEK